MFDRIADLHTHTVFSDGKLEPGEVIAIAGQKGYLVGLADHCGPGSFQLEDEQKFDLYMEAMAGLPAYRAVELDLGRDIPVPVEKLKRCDYLIGGVHSVGKVDFFDPGVDRIDVEKLMWQALEAVEEKALKYRFDILAHPGLLPQNYRDRGFELSRAWRTRLVELAQKYGFALEISSRWLSADPELAAAAKLAGLKFSLGSDGHKAENMCRLDYSLELAGKLGLEDRDLFWPLDGTIPWQTNPGSARPSP
jgi:histidinol phosphatase-like PHP family hydrolase